MTCLTLNRSRPLSVTPLVVVLAALIVAYGSHAVLQHGVYAEKIRTCLENQPPVMRLVNPITGRVANVCPLDDHFGVQITEGEKEVTSFPNKHHILSKVIHYLNNAGYTVPVP